ncbi:MAG: glycosyltransferase family 39 protein [Pirellulaceae bacterium]
MTTIFGGVNNTAPDMHRVTLLGSNSARVSRPCGGGDRRPPLRGVLWLIPIVALGLWLRCSQARESLWLDELHTSWVVADGLSQIPERAQAGNQSPLYFYLEWGTIALLGHHEWTLRFWSLVAGTVLMAAVGGLVQRWSGSVASGLLAALLVAVQRDCIFYAQEARPYALLQLSAVLHAALFVELWKRPTRVRRMAFVVGGAWLFYLHYTSVLFLLAEALCLAILYAGQRTPPCYRLRSSLLDGVVFAVLLVPAWQHVLQIAQHRHNWARLLDVWPAPGLQIAGAIFVLAPVVALAAAGWLGLRPAIFRWRSTAGLWTLCWFAVPPGLALLSTWSGFAALAMVRYLVASLAGAIVFAALCHARYSSGTFRWVLAVALTGGTILSSGMIAQWRHDGRWIGDRHEPWNELVMWLNERWPADPGPLFLCSGLLEDAALQDSADPDLRHYCLFPVNGLYRVTATLIEPLPTGRHIRLADRPRQLARAHGGVWVVIRAGEKTADLLSRSLASQLAARPVEKRRFGNLVAIRLEL